jgi:hypothetical protein
LPDTNLLGISEIPEHDKVTVGISGLVRFENPHIIHFRIAVP